MFKKKSHFIERPITLKNLFIITWRWVGYVGWDSKFDHFYPIKIVFSKWKKKIINIYVHLYTYILYATSKSCQPQKIYLCESWWTIMNFLFEVFPVPGVQGTTEVSAAMYFMRKFSILTFAAFILRFGTCMKCKMCRELDSLQTQTRWLLKVIKNETFGITF